MALVRRRRRAPVAGAFAAVLAFGVGTARADPNPPREREPRFGIAATLEGSFADPAAAQSLGIRVALARHLILGLDGELNEWIGVNGGRIEPGAANVYASAILRFPLVYVPLNLRTTLQLGTSIELADLYGVPSGSVGIYGGIYPLGLEWRLGRHAFLVFDPLGLAVPVPHLVGVPYAYPQFRTKVGVEITL